MHELLHEKRKSEAGIKHEDWNKKSLGASTSG